MSFAIAKQAEFRVERHFEEVRPIAPIGGEPSGSDLLSLERLLGTTLVSAGVDTIDFSAEADKLESRAPSL